MIALLTIYFLFYGSLFSLAANQEVSQRLDTIITVDRDQRLSLSYTDVEILFELYNATKGENWLWRTGPNAAPIWTFNNLKQQNPCADDSFGESNISAWQGLTCDSTPDLCYSGVINCSITWINLSEYQVKFMWLSDEFNCILQPRSNN